MSDSTPWSSRRIRRRSSGPTRVDSARLFRPMSSARRWPYASSASRVAGRGGAPRARGRWSRGWTRAALRSGRRTGEEALRQAGIAPLRLAPKDGLALVSANGVSIGWASIVADRAATLVEAGDVVLAISLEAINGNLSIVDPAVAVAKGIPGQTAAADHLRRLLAESRVGGVDNQSSVQDPLSFRVGPQVHGAAREFVGLLGQAVETELNASDDNPLVLADGRLISNGNFHPIVLALCLDALRPALAHVGQLSDRRMNHIWERAFGAPDVALPSGLLRMTRHGRGRFHRYGAATRAAALRALAAPVTLDIGPLDNGVEDHATNAAEAARVTADALDAL